DADLASNNMGWQWASGCGADAAPYFRIFNPVRQSEKFDGKAEYIRKWVPELGKLSDKEIHEPWLLPEAKRGGIDYPAPIVDLAASRQRALEAYSKIKKAKD
ncbi:MAG: FAD-binding domain-containing protein, partial [Leucothrix sp.]